MSNVIADRVKETTTTTGTGDLALGGAATGYRAFSAVCLDGDIVPYCVALGAAFEVGVGRYNLTANTLTRLEVKASSNAGALVNLAAGTKDIFITAVAAQMNAIGAFPTFAAGLMFRYHADLSRTDLNTQGYVTKMYDISGNGRHSDTAAVNRTPRYLYRGFNRGYNGVQFFGSHRMTFSAIPALTSPLTVTILFSVQNAKQQSGNSHIYNWSGNPIGFGSTDPLSFMYNGTLPAAHLYPSQSDLPPDFLSWPCGNIHMYNGASSIQSINNLEETKSPGTAASGTTFSFTLGGDSNNTTPANFSRFILREFAIVPGTVTAAERAKYWQWLRADCGIVTP